MTLYSSLLAVCCCLMAYLVGSIPFGYLLGRVFGAGDIRTIGSGNIGATNVLRTGRKGLAAATLLLDFVKGVVAIAVAQGMYNALFNHYNTYFTGDFRMPAAIPSIRCFAGTAAVLGHVFPVWLRFKGGKGVATTLGVLVAIFPLIGCMALVGWAMLFYLTRVSSLASMGSIIGTPILAIMNEGKPDFIIMAFVLSALIIYKHKDNIRRLREGTETVWMKKKDDAA